MDLTERAIQLEAFETDPWAAKAILRHELMTKAVIDPCVGTGILTRAAQDEGYQVWTVDIFDWSTLMDFAPVPMHIGDWLNRFEGPPHPRITSLKWTAFMNPPFQTACEFVDRAMELGAYKVVCFQRFAWRESAERAEWWAKNPPARIWLCVDRATCWRFDIPVKCVGEIDCGRGNGKGSTRCRQCMAGTTTAHAFYVWERGHKGAEILNILRKP